MSVLAGSKLRDLIGIPFADRGRDLSGLDCWGLAMVAMLRYGKDVPDFDVSCFDTPSIHAIYEGQKTRWAWEQVDKPEPGDLAAMCLDPRHPGLIQHVGVFIGDNRIIHTMKKRASHLVKADDPYWSRKIVSYYRWIG